MKEEIKNVKLAFCCKENWNQFATLDERTRFCGSCKHTVIDFTNASREELEKTLSCQERVCGRFTRLQMSESFLKLAAASMVIAATTIGCAEPGDVNPQLTPVEEPTEIVFMGDVEFMGILFDEVDTVTVSKDSTSANRVGK